MRDHSTGHGHGWYAIVPASVAADHSLSKGALRVLIALASHANPARLAWPKHRTLCAELGLDYEHGGRRSVRGWLAELVEAGYIRSGRYVRADGGYGSNRYEVAPFMTAAGERGDGAISPPPTAQYDRHPPGAEISTPGVIDAPSPRRDSDATKNRPGRTDHHEQTIQNGEVEQSSRTRRGASRPRRRGEVKAETNGHKSKRGSEGRSSADGSERNGSHPPRRFLTPQEQAREQLKGLVNADPSLLPPDVMETWFSEDKRWAVGP